MKKYSFGLIGKNIQHSFSPSYFAKKFQKENIKNRNYQLFPLAQISDFPRLLEDNSSLKGLNVTIPYKQAILAYLDELSPQAQAIGAVNTIEFSHGKLIGHNTDIWGFQKSLEKILPPSSCPSKALILGTGGASLAVRYVLENLGINYQLVSRQRSPNTLIYADISKDLMLEYPLIINTTPLGMSPHIDRCPSLLYTAINANHLLFDLIYNPSETLFLKKGKAAGATIQNGLEMLELQADKAWDIWQKKY